MYFKVPETSTDVSIGDAFTSKKYHALGRIATFISFKKRRTLMKAFIESQSIIVPKFGYFTQK